MSFSNKIFSKLIEDFGLYTIAKIIPTITDVVALVVFTNVFLPEEYGKYALIASATTIGSTVGYGWIRQSILRFEPQHDEQGFLFNMAVLLVVSNLCILIFIVLLYQLFTSALTPYQSFYPAATALTLSMGTYHTLKTYLRSKLQSRAVLKFSIGRSTLGLVASLFLALVILGDIVGWVWGSAIGYSVFTFALIAEVFYVQRRVQLSHIQVELMRKMVVYGFPLVGWMIGTTFLDFSDRLIIEFIRGSRETGIYSSNYSIVHYGLMTVFLPFNQAAQPILMNLWDGDNEGEIRDAISKMTRYFLLVGIPAVCLFAIMSQSLSQLFLGVSYTQGAILMPIVGVGVFFWNAANIGQKGLEIREQTTILFAGVSLSVTINIMLNFVLVSFYGYIGAAVATLISFFTYFVYIYVISQNYISWELPWKSLRNTLLACSGLTLPFLGLWLTDFYELSYLVLASLVGTVFYAFVIVLCGEVTHEEIRQLRKKVTQL